MRVTYHEDYMRVTYHEGSYYMRGVTMDTVKEFDPYSCGTCILRFGKGFWGDKNPEKQHDCLEWAASLKKSRRNYTGKRTKKT